jgi:hypothetical protein
MFFDNPVNGEKDQSYPDKKICLFMVYLMTVSKSVSSGSNDRLIND